MKVSSKYMRVLETYGSWKSVLTPASGSFQEEKAPTPAIWASPSGVGAAEALCKWESTGQPSYCLPEERALLEQYVRGKRQRDWWTKEIGWWNKEAVFIPEEFLPLLDPLPFIELLGRAPITRLARYYHDNTYHLWEFKLDTLMKGLERAWGMSYFERDDRDSAVRNAWRMIRVKWFDPAVYRLKRKISKERP